MKDVSTAFFAGFFTVIALAILFVKSDNTSSIISSLGNSLAKLGASLESGYYAGD